MLLLFLPALLHIKILLIDICRFSNTIFLGKVEILSRSDNAGNYFTLSQISPCTSVILKRNLNFGISGENCFINPIKIRLLSRGQI